MRSHSQQLCISPYNLERGVQENPQDCQVCGVTSFTNGGYPEAHSWPFRGRIITSARIYPWASPLSITMLDEIAGDGLGGSGITLVPKVC